MKKGMRVSDQGEFCIQHILSGVYIVRKAADEQSALTGLEIGFFFFIMWIMTKEAFYSKLKYFCWILLFILTSFVVGILVFQRG